ncbi:amidohydrolase [Microbacterium sp. NEAU-LLC]|uniref:Amidohydrolase n=1 Tax=Microbacterium helvum TaxID=2773713 RepID=A0ABR8NN56_9MICO|nr:amidohydrolase family protein [Microbacterium helvum]MBD3942094.1 amidohydrolase [Microbacterium helvum]
MSLVVDTDVHNALPDLTAYLPMAWREAWRHQGLPPGQYINPRGGVARHDVTPPNGGPPASDPYFLISDHLDRYDIDYGILTGPHLLALGTDPDYLNALAVAHNDCTMDYWLPVSDRFRGSILVNGDEPEGAVREIRRCAVDRRFAQVIMSSATRRPLGQRQYHPIYEAAVEAGLPIAVHPGTEGAGTAGPPTPVGWPSRYMEWHNILPIGYMAQINSLVTEGVFEMFPTLRFVAIEGGTAWLPHLMWRMDKNYKALRDTTPWLRRLPSEYILDHVLLTTQPLEEPRHPGELEQIFAMIEAGRTLMFSSDYPHWDFDNRDVILRAIDPAMRDRIMGGTAAEVYGLTVRPAREQLPAHLPVGASVVDAGPAGPGPESATRWLEPVE